MALAEMEPDQDAATALPAAVSPASQSARTSEPPGASPEPVVAFAAIPSPAEEAVSSASRVGALQPAERHDVPPAPSEASTSESGSAETPKNESTRLTAVPTDEPAAVKPAWDDPVTASARSSVEPEVPAPAAPPAVRYDLPPEMVMIETATEKRRPAVEANTEDSSQPPRPRRRSPASADGPVDEPLVQIETRK